ncbi:MAG: NUDIX hydrolase [Intrasporangium sp.]|uniref:NUDIX hydrolase n=1 Tax=Intrasporangium sp. TaxID=1925024 RepID=UPI003F80DAD1
MPTEPAHTEPVHAEPIHAEPVHAEPIHAEPIHTFVTVPPAERPRRVRRTARVLLVDDLDRILLFSDSDPGLPGRRWWITPGGGVDPGETDLAAAVREVEEETGCLIQEAQLIGPVLVRQVVHGYSDVLIEQEDTFYACWVPAFEVSVVGHTEQERLTLESHRWWTRTELATTDEEIWPTSLLALWADAEQRRAELDSGLPPRTPADGGTVEESTVPA